MNGLLDALRRIESKRAATIESAPAANGPIKIETSPRVERPVVVSAVSEPVGGELVTEKTASSNLSPGAVVATEADLPPRADIAIELRRGRQTEANDAAARALANLFPRTGRLVFAFCGPIDGPAQIVSDLAESLKCVGRAPVEVLGPGAFRLRRACGEAVFAAGADEFVHATVEQLLSDAESFLRCDGVILVVERSITDVEAARRAAAGLRRGRFPLLGALYVD